MEHIKTFNSFIAENWGPEDDACERESEKIESECLKRFVKWAKENAGTRQVKLDKNGYVIDIAEIDGVKYKWYERGDNSNGWCNWNLFMYGETRVYARKDEYNIIGPNRNYIDVIDFKEWNNLFESLYTDYTQHPIDDKALYDRQQRREMEEFNELD